MNIKISRNAPCPCGSGKKYKKCCGLHEAVSITQVIESEIDELQKQILHYAMWQFGEEIKEDFEEFKEGFFIQNNDEGTQFFELIHSIWFTLFKEDEDGETILEKFIAAELRKIKRPRLKQILQSWTEARVMAGKIIRYEDPQLTVEDGFTSEKVEAVILTKMQETYKEGEFFVGFLVPFDQKFLFFPAPFDVPGKSPEQAIDFIEDRGLDAGYDSPQEFLSDFTIEIMYDLLTDEMNMTIENLQWPGQAYQVVAEVFQEQLEMLDEPKEVIDSGIMLWFQFCQKRQKRIQNPNIYVAALHYLVSTIIPIDSMSTQKEFAEHYGVSTGSMASIYREMDNVLSDEIGEIVGTIFEEEDEPSPVTQFGKQGSIATERVIQEALAELEGKNFESIEEITSFLNNRVDSPKKTPKGNKEQAQQLIYDAFESEGNKRYSLARKALDLNPDSVDAYNILAEEAESLEEASQIYKKGMLTGQKELGKNYFRENKGHFWGLHETRPFMRAKGNYASTLYQLGNINEAILHFKELLQLNPNDNQGARYSLFIAYVDKGDLRKALELLEQYDEGSAQGLYNKLLLELLEHGFTAKAKKLLKEAKSQNKYVIPFLTGKKRLPSQIPDMYGWGDEGEAIIYADAHLHLWKKVVGVENWLK